MSLQSDYIDDQFEGLGEMDGEYLPSLKVHSGGGETNWISVTWDQLAKIKAILVAPLPGKERKAKQVKEA